MLIDHGLAELTSRLTRISNTSTMPSRAFAPTSHAIAGLETRLDPAEYYFDGNRRGGDAAHPYVVIQYTLDGVGAFEDGSQTHILKTGDVFFAVVPSDHRYYLPRTSNGWTFFYLLVRHRYSVQRIAAATALAGPVHSMPIDSALTPRLIRLYEAIRSGLFADNFDEEAALVDFAIGFDRHAHDCVYPKRRRDRLLESVRSLVIATEYEPLDVTELASQFGMTRSGFSHHFKSLTGLAPATYMRQVRLEQAAQLLIQTDQKLEAIASTCRFGSANDLCKQFRKYYHQSPTSFRRLSEAPKANGE